MGTIKKIWSRIDIHCVVLVCILVFECFVAFHKTFATMFLLFYVAMQLVNIYLYSKCQRLYPGIIHALTVETDHLVIEN